jgi:hypothetical protein
MTPLRIHRTRDCIEALGPARARAFIERLSSEMNRAGCNDVFLEEFPQSVCDRFDTDFGVLAAFAAALERTTDSPGRDVFDGGLGSAY